MSDARHAHALHIRRATPADTPLLVEFACAMAWETERKRLDPARVARGIAGLHEQPARGHYLVAERDGRIDGALMVTLEWSDWRCADWWWVQSVYVRPQARRSGVFSALYRDVAARAAADPGVCGIRLYVEHDNSAAQATYERLGMQRSHYHLYEHELDVEKGDGGI